MTAASEIRAFLEARDAADPAVGSGMRSVMLEGTDADVIVLLHGLTASPPAWHGIAAALNARGATVIVPRLPLHGHADRLSTALLGLRTESLLADLRAVIDVLSSLERRITIAGHSLGGTLALHAAATSPSVDRVVAIAPFLGIAALPYELHFALLPLIRTLPNLFLWWDPVERERQQPEHGYPRYPLHALAVGLEIARAVGAAAERAPRVRAIDFVINAQETSVNNRVALRLAARWRAAGGSVAVHQLDGLPPSHDIIEPRRAHSQRAFDTLVRVIADDHRAADAAYAI